MKNRLPIVILAVVFVVAIGILLSRKAPQNNNQVAKPPAVTVTMGSLIEPAAQGQKTVELTVTAAGGKFSPATLNAPVGARVLLTFVNLDSSYHNLTLMGKYLQTATPTIAPNQQVTISFFPSQAKTITYYDSVSATSSASATGMKGTLVIQ
jgi:plastocyanin